MIKEKLIAIINTYNTDSYYKYGSIPIKKMQAASQNYPVDPSDTALALIDTTVFGSAKTGMVIGLKGIYFKNDWSTKTDKNFISWDELSNTSSNIGNGAAFCISLAPGCDFNMSGASMKRELLINLLNQLIDLYGTITSDTVVAEKSNSPQIINTQDTEVIIDNSSLYSELIPELISICMTADGEVEEGEVELATAFIESDELIIDKTAALVSLSENMEKMVADRQKSKAIFKMKISPIIAKVSQIEDQLQKDKINIILDGMLEAAEEDDSTDTVDVINTIKGKI